ncbi:VOC family protein [Mycobacterium manitobense]|uniref:VOC family protein n=1 Tax=[Mycobacterium] manitobense TaxID=190147 RepID=A0A9X2YSL0_9MYCO|nr:VOC family protein [[Mycobacterium] manitobense]MCV7173428.1 VOC family protein [[Mycobacterium] manitobense]
MPESPFAGPVRQFGYVVDDFDRALDGWLAAGVGPWFVLRGLPQAGLYRGEPCEVTLSIGMTNIGDMQIEVIQQEDDAPSVYSEFLASGRHGFHQLAWWVDDFDAALKAAADRGWPVVWSGGQDVGVRFAYVEPQAGPAAIYEITERSDAIVGLDAMLRAATADWDGTDPVRRLN